jgi:hypothetical protein
MIGQMNVGILVSIGRSSVESGEDRMIIADAWWNDIRVQW